MLSLPAQASRHEEDCWVAAGSLLNSRVSYVGMRAARKSGLYVGFQYFNTAWDQLFAQPPKFALGKRQRNVTHTVRQRHHTQRQTMAPALRPELCGRNTQMRMASVPCWRDRCAWKSDKQRALVETLEG